MLLDRSLGDDEAGGDAGVRQPFRHQRQHLLLTRREIGERIVLVPLRHELLNQGRIDDRAARSYALERIHQVVDAQDAVLEQVADPLASFEQVDCRLDLDVGGQEQDPDLGMRRADRARCLETFPGLARRHADIDDRHVRHRLAHGRHERLPVARTADDVVPGVGKETGDALAYEDVVIGDDNAPTAHPWPKRIAGTTNISPAGRRDIHPPAS